MHSAIRYLKEGFNVIGIDNIIQSSNNLKNTFEFINWFNSYYEEDINH